MKWLYGEVVCISGQMNWSGCCAEMKSNDCFEDWLELLLWRG